MMKTYSSSTAWAWGIQLSLAGGHRNRLTGRRYSPVCSLSRTMNISEFGLNGCLPWVASARPQRAGSNKVFGVGHRGLFSLLRQAFLRFAAAFSSPALCRLLAPRDGRAGRGFARARGKQLNGLGKRQRGRIGALGYVGVDSAMLDVRPVAAGQHAHRRAIGGMRPQFLDRRGRRALRASAAGALLGQQRDRAVQADVEHLVGVR